MSEAGKPAPTTPSNLPALIPPFWRSHLFPTSQTNETGWRLSAVVILLAVSGLLLYPCLSFYLFEPDEGRYAQIPREMLERGDWIVPRLHGKPYLDKPPLLYWLVMLSYSVFGCSDGAARLVPALAVQGCVLLTYLLGRRLVGERSAFWGALLLTAAPGFVSVGRLLVLDGLLAFWVVLGWFAVHAATRGSRFHFGWWLVAALACGCGVLTKGPIALVLVLPPLIVHLWLLGDLGKISRRAWLGFGGTVLAVALPWYAAICLRVPDFAGHFLWEHNVVRFLAPFDHIRPIWFYLPIVVGGMLPGSLLLFGLCRRLLSLREEDRRNRPRELGYLLLAAGWCFIFFSLSGCKLPTYVLPCFPPLALALGCYWMRSSWKLSRWMPAMLATSFAGLVCMHFWLIPEYAEFRSPMSRAVQVASYCQDRSTPVVCYPRPIDSVAFYLGRSDFANYRSKDTPEMIEYLDDQPRTVILFSHRHSLEALREVLPKHLRLTGEVPLSGSWKNFKTEYCYMAIVERVR